MMSRLMTGLLASAIALSCPGVVAHAAERVVLAPHRAVYDLKLDSARPSRSVDQATGRIAFDFNGDACEGYALSFRQVTILDSAESGRRQIDVRTTNFEDGDAKMFRFKTQSVLGNRTDERVDGIAERVDGSYRVQIRQPKPDRFTFGNDVVFPSEHLKRVVSAARQGEKTLNIKVYDGSDDGKQVYDTFAVIGARVAPGSLSSLEAPVQLPELERLARWPVSISYFKVGSGEVSPAYSISFDLFENGITRALAMDYRDFRMTGELVKLDMLKAGTCEK